MPPKGRRNNPLISAYWLEVEPLLDTMVGQTLTVEELLNVLPDHRDGRRPRGKTAVRRLRHRLEVVFRGPNGVLGRGSTLRVLPPPAPVVGDEHVMSLEREFLRLLGEVDAEKGSKDGRVGRRRGPAGGAGR